jgi:folate-binding protein YgfZ
MESDLWVYAAAEDLLIECPPGTVGRVVATLNKHIVSDRVEIADISADFGILSVQGPQSAAVIETVMQPVTLPAKPLDHCTAAGGDARIVSRNRTGSGGFDIWLPIKETGSYWQGFLGSGQAVPVGLHALRWARAEAGIPWYGLDMDERTLPMEMGLDDAISLDKGCYRGQEIVARVRFRGHLDRNLRGIKMEGKPEPHSEVRLQDQKIGELTSVEFSPVLGKPLGLAVLKKSVSSAGVDVQVVSGQGYIPGSIVELPLNLIR